MNILKSNILFHYPFKYEFLKENSAIINWDIVLQNRNIDWSIKHLELVGEKLNIKFRRNNILNNSRIASNNEILIYFINKLDTSRLPGNWMIDWDENLIEAFSSKIESNKISANLNVPLKYIENNESKIDWNLLSYNRKIKWNLNFIGKYKDKFDWLKLSYNPSLPWDETLISKFEKRWNWKYLSRNPSVKWSESLVNKFENLVSWKDLCSNSAVYFSETFVKNNLDKIDLFEFSNNKSFKWTLDFINDHQESLNFGAFGLSWNTSIPWSKELLKLFERKWSWSGISYNVGIPWNIKLINEFKNSLVFGKNDNLSFKSTELSYSRNGFNLSNNPELPWSHSFIEEYKDRWTTLMSNIGIWNKVIKSNLTDSNVEKILKENDAEQSAERQ